MSEMSDLFDSLDAGDLEEIAGKLNVAPKKEPEPIVEEVEAPVVEAKKERKYVRFDNLNEQVADLFDNSELFPTDIPLPKPKPKAPQVKPRQSFVESAAKALTQQVKNTPKYEAKPLRETVSVEERIKLLEQDLFRVQAQATPNTLVAGIGASLDSGGGAVWLWDLEDVNIGTPLNGVYPSITNGAVLRYNGSTNQWVPGSASSGGGGTVTTDDVNLVNPLTAEILAAALQTLPTPSSGVSTQTDANQWFKDSILYLDEAIGGENGNLELTGNLDFTGTTATQSLRKFNNTNPEIKIELGSTTGDTVSTFRFTEGFAESVQPLHLVANATGSTGILRVNAIGDSLKIFGVDADGAKFFRGAVVERPTDAGYIQDSYQIKGVKTAGASSTALLTVDYASDTTTTPDTVQYLGQILSDNDLATKKYVDDNAGAGASEGWNTTGVTNLTGACDIRLTESNNALRFLNSDGTMMFRLADTNDKVEFAVPVDFDKGFHIANDQDIVLDGGNSKLLMKDGEGTAFELSDDGGNVFLRANTAGSEGFIFYKSLSDTNDSTRVKFRAYEPPGGSHFYLTTTDADSLDFIDKDTNEIYLRFNTSAKKLQVSDADVELSVVGTTNTGQLETKNWYVTNSSGVADAGHIYIQDNDGVALDIQNAAGGSPHLRFKTTDSAEATLFYQPIQTSNGSLVLGSDGTITTSQTATFNGAIVHDPSSNAAVDFGAFDGSSARSMVRFNRRLANTAGQTDLVIRGYREGENTVKDIFQVKNNNPATEGDEILYYGETTTNDNCIQTKASVAALISAGGGGVSFTFKGTVDVTAANPPADVDAGDYYANSTAGNAGANWTGIAGDAIGLNQLIIYKADGNWVAGGGVSGAYLPITGGTVTGDTTFDEEVTVKKDLTVGSGGEITLSGDGNPGLVSATTGLFSGGLAVNHTSVDASVLCLVAAANTTEFFAVRGDGTVSVGTDISTSDTTADAVTLAPTGNITSTGGIVVDRPSAPNNILDVKLAGTRTAQILANGNAQFASTSTTGTLTIANTGETNALIIKDGSTTTAQIYKSGGAIFAGAVTGASFKLTNNSRFNVNTSGLATVTGLTSNDAIIANSTLTVAGATTVGVVGNGVQSNFYGGMQLKAATTGTTSGEIIIKNISDQATLTLSNDGAISTKNSLRFNDTTANQNIRAFGNAAKTLTIGVSNSIATVPADNVFTENLILSRSGTTTNGDLTVNGGTNYKVKFKRGSAAVNYSWDIEGTTEADNTDVTQRLFAVYRNTPGVASDAISYFGRVAGAENIQTKASVEALIAATPAGESLLKGGTVKKTGGSTSTSGNLAIQSTDTSSGNLFIRDASANTLIQLHRTGDVNMGANLVMGNVTTLNSNTKLIDGVSTGSTNFSFRTSSDGSSFTERFNIATNKVTSKQNFVSAGTTEAQEQLILTGYQSGNNTSDFADSKAQIKYDSTGKYASIWKTGAVDSSGFSGNNQIRFLCGTNTTTGNVGIRYPVLNLANQQGTFSVTVGPVDVSNVRQDFDNEVVVMKTLSTTTINATNVVSTTADSTDEFGDAQKTTTQTSATVPADLTFSGTNIHNGTNTHNGEVFHNGELHIGDDLNLLGSGAISHINCSGNNNKAIQFNSTNSTGAKTQVSRFSVAESVLNGTQTYISSQKIHLNSGDLNLSKAAATQYITVTGAATKSLAITSTDDDSVGVTAMNIKHNRTHINGGLQIIRAMSHDAANTEGCLSFKVGSNTDQNSKGYILFEGSGQNDGTVPAEYVFARDTTTGNVADIDTYFKLTAGRGTSNVCKTTFVQPVEVPTPTQDAQAATKAYVDAHASGLSDGQQSGTYTVTFDGTGTTPTTKKTATAHFRKYGHLVHLHLTVDSLDLSGYANGSIRITGLQHQPDTSIGEQIGHIHGVNFMSNTAHADDGHIAVVDHDATYGSHIKVFSEQVDQETVYISGSNNAKVRISLTYIATA